MVAGQYCLQWHTYIRFLEKCLRKHVLLVEEPDARHSGLDQVEGVRTRCVFTAHFNVYSSFLTLLQVSGVITYHNRPC